MLNQTESATEYYQFSMISPNGEVYNPHNTFETNESTTIDDEGTPRSAAKNQTGLQVFGKSDSNDEDG